MKYKALERDTDPKLNGSIGEIEQLDIAGLFLVVEVHEE